MFRQLLILLLVALLGCSHGFVRLVTNPRRYPAAINPAVDSQISSQGTALHAVDPEFLEIANRALDKVDAFGAGADAFATGASAFATGASAGASAFATGASAFATGASAFAVVALALLSFSVYQTTVGMRLMSAQTKVDRDEDRAQTKADRDEDRAQTKADRDEDRAAMQTMRNETNQKFATTTVFTVISILISTAPFTFKYVSIVTANVLAFLQSGLT
jgi:hypothetical protein